MPKTIAELAQEARDHFEIAERPDGGEEFIRTRDGAPAWVKDLVKAAHDVGWYDLMLPDDRRYQFIVEALDYIAEMVGEYEPPEAGDWMLDFADQSVNVYTSDRLAWLTSHPKRLSYVDDAVAEFGTSDDEGQRGIVEQIGLGQLYEAQEVATAVLRALQERQDAAE